MIQNRSFFDLDGIDLDTGQTLLNEEKKPEPIKEEIKEQPKVEEKKEESIVTKQQNTVTRITSNGNVEEKEEYENYSVQIKAKKGREVYMILKVVKAKSKNEASTLARQKLYTEGFEEGSVSYCRANLSKVSDKDTKSLFEVLDIKYEVTFCIKIGEERFKKTFIIKAKDENQARERMILRCKKEFSNYRTINKVEIKEATEESKESSELFVDESKEEPKIIVDNLKNEKEKKEEFDENNREELEKFFLSEMNKNIELLPKEIAETKIVEIKLTAKDKEIRRDMEKFDVKGAFIVRADNKSDAERKFKEHVEDIAPVNRKFRRQVRFNYSYTNFKSLIERRMREVLVEASTKSFEEYKETGSEASKEKVEEYKRENNIKNENEVSESLMEKCREGIRRLFNNIKEDILSALDLMDGIETENEEDEKKNYPYAGETKIRASDIKTLDFEVDESGKLLRIKSKGMMLLAQQPNTLECTLILKNGEETNTLLVDATSNDEAMKLILTAITGGLIKGLDADGVASVRILDRKAKNVQNLKIKDSYEENEG